MVKRKRSGTLALILFVAALLLVILACGTPAPEYILRGWTVTPSLTSVVAQATQTPFVVEQTVVVAQIISATPDPTSIPDILCVVAQEAVNLRPSPSDVNYPVLALQTGQQVLDLGGRSGLWHFYEVIVNGQTYQGWINSTYIGSCG